MNLKDIKQSQIYQMVRIIWTYRLPDKVTKILAWITRNKELKNIILIESHNDFDMNGGAFYHHLINNGYNKKYKIVWLIKNKNILKRVRSKKLPFNVEVVPMFYLSVKRSYFNCIARYAFFDCCFLKKIKDGQVFVYLGHATRAMKNCRGLVDVPKDIDYIISASEFNNILMSDIYKADISKFVVTGFPVTDVFYADNKKRTNIDKELKNYRKIIVWMPTFRKTPFADGRCDGKANYETGLPLIKSKAEFERLNDKLQKLGIRLVIKFHPGQDMDVIRVSTVSNILLLSPNDIKRQKINPYELIIKTDALISDYSSISFDYLLLNKPIAYVLDDYNDYKLGFAVDDPLKYMPGSYIYTIKDMETFIDMISDGREDKGHERIKLRDMIHKYQDGKSCERIAEFLRL